VIRGGPGTGKSTVIRLAVEALERMGKKVAVTASTGIASVNLSSAKVKASTIHRCTGLFTIGMPSFNLIPVNIILKFLLKENCAYSTVFQNIECWPKRQLCLKYMFVQTFLYSNLLRHLSHPIFCYIILVYTGYF
jgi:hypothetical protein